MNRQYSARNVARRLLWPRISLATGSGHPAQLRRSSRSPLAYSQLGRRYVATSLACLDCLTLGAAARENPSAAVFTVVWTACLLFILYSFIKSCFRGRTTGTQPSGTRPLPPGSGPGSGWFGSGGSGGFFNSDPHDAPPPYSKYPTGSTPGVGSSAGGGFNPGFWTGAALGGLGTYLFNRNQRERVYPRPAAYDWEHDRLFRPTPPAPFGTGSSSFGRRSAFSSDDRGEGPSNLGSMRRSTGLGGSNVR